MIDRVAQVVRRYGYWLVLALIAVSYVLCAVQESPHPNPAAFVAQLATVAVALWIAGVPTTILRVCWGVLAFAVVAVVVTELAGTRGHVLDVTLAAASVVACLVTPTAIIAHQVRLRRPGVQNLLAAVTAYVMVGMMFTFVYNLAALLYPAPVLTGETGDSLRGQLFFSFTTLTTTGYGNLVPVGPFIETVAIVEAITGQLFIVVAIASMITLPTARDATPSEEESR